jgi:hypothetical protein
MKIPRGVVNLIFLLSLGGFCLGLVLHALTYFRIDPRDSVPIVWYSFQIVSALGLIPIMIGNLRQSERHEPPARSHDRFQLTVGIAFTVFALYLVFNFIFTGSFLLHDATPEIVNGNFALASHGASRTVTKAAFLKFRVYEARLNSGHWMALCSLISWEIYDYLRK